MTDVHSREVRSFNMSRIKGKNTKPEILIRKFLFSKGFRFRLHSLNLPGKPDIVLPKYKTVIFVNGCFWHGHEGCKYFVVPKTNTEWWLKKIGRNRQLDEENARKFKCNNWNVIAIFECELKIANLDFTLNNLINKLIKLTK
mgnify:CR=1 FL=1